MLTRTRLFLALLLLTAFSALSVSAQKIDHIMFFGDSLSDPGNHFIQTGQSSRQPFLFEPPDASYDIGGHHFSNGNTWAEQLATALHLPTSGDPALRGPSHFTNYAVGGARSRGDLPCSIPATLFPHCGLTSQVNSFLGDFGGHVPANSLVVIWIGANDVDDALSALSFDPSGQTSVAILQQALQSLQANVGMLYGAGARMFLIANVPNLGFTPFVRALGPGAMAVAGLFTDFFDGYIGQFVAALPFVVPPDPTNPLAVARLFDVNALFAQVLASPGSFGFSNVADRCTVPLVVGNAICSTPNRYLFWDAIHPTAAGHNALADAALKLLPPQ
jgi:phospholipase/lecithinase/hemolysin